MLLTRSVNKTCIAQEHFTFSVDKSVFLSFFIVERPDSFVEIIDYAGTI